LRRTTITINQGEQLMKIMDGKSFELYREQHGVRRCHFAKWSHLNYITVYSWERNPKRTPPQWGVQLLKAYVEILSLRREMIKWNSPAFSNNGQSQGAQP
jgi:DNA-binding transcriptional regulator YiaG